MIEILDAMLEMNATIDRPASGPTILSRACCVTNDKKAFDRLDRCKLIDGKRGVGRWLTPKGMALEQRISEEGS